VVGDATIINHNDDIASFVVVIDDDNYTSDVVVVVDVNVMMLFHGFYINNRWNLH